MVCTIYLTLKLHMLSMSLLLLELQTLNLTYFSHFLFYFPFISYFET